MYLEGICIVENKPTGGKLGPAYIFSNKDLKVFSIRLETSISIGTWIVAQLGKTDCDVYEVVEYATSQESAAKFEFARIQDTLLISTNICYKWSRLNGDKMFVASVELGEVLIDRPSYIKDNRIYLTYAKFVLEYTHPPFGHFVSTGLIESVLPQDQIEAMRILKNRKERERQDDCAELDVMVQKNCTAAICLDVYPSESEFIVECYSIKNRELYKFRTREKGIAKTYEILIMPKSVEKHGFSDVELIRRCSATSLGPTGVILGKDGAVCIKTNVGISNCIHHESYSGQVFWAEHFGRVLPGAECATVDRYRIYWTYVRKVCFDLDDDSTDINFEICDLLKPVSDEETIRRCQKQMLKDEDEFYQLHQGKLNVVPSLSNQERGQPSVVGGSRFSAPSYPVNLMRGNGMCVDLNRLPKLIHKKMQSFYMSMNSQRELMLVTKIGKNMSEAWSRSHGRVMVPDIRVKENGIFLRQGHWFYGAISFANLCSNGEPIFRVKKVECLTGPLAYTEISSSAIHIELEVNGSPVDVLKEESVIIIDNSSVGKIRMTLDEYSKISKSRVVALLKFNDDNPYHLPWQLVKILRTLGKEEYFPLLSKDCLHSDHQRLSFGPLF